MITFIITPCLFGFDVKIRENYNSRSLGLFQDFGDIIALLCKNWKHDFTVEVR